jgi:hypothetical protein
MMKKALVPILVASLMLACNPGSDQSKISPLEQPLEEHQEHEKKPAVLVLKNGVKWNADSTTLLNVARFQNIVNNAKNGSLDEYQQTAGQLGDGLSRMVTECKMKGADHEALHQWLEPLMEKTRELKMVSNVENAATLLSEIGKQLALFPQYFE